MGVSLLLYIGWTVGSMLARHKHDAEFSAIVDRGLPLLEEMNEWDTVERKTRRAMISFNRWLPWVFRPSLYLAVAGASVLIIGALAAAI